MQIDNYAIANQKNCSHQKYTNMRRPVISVQSSHILLI